MNPIVRTSTPALLRSLGFGAALVSLVGAGALAACGGSDSTTPTASDAGSDGTTPGVDGSNPGTDSSVGGDAAPPVSQACADSAKARCMRNDACSNSTSNKSRYGDEMTCETRVAAQCIKNLGAPGTGATAASVETCGTTTSGESCDQYLGNDPDDTCLPPAGTLAASAACAVSAQCQSTYCAVPAHSTCGVCATVPKAGDPCGTTGECGGRGGLRCVNQVCVIEGAANADCGDGAPCGPSLSCVGAKGATLGKCMAAVVAADSTCDPAHKTGPGCDNDLGLYCDPSTSKCVAYTFANDGQPCGEVAGGLVACTAGTCILASAGDAGLDAGDGGDNTPKSGTCKALALEGSACDTANGPVCEGPAKCIITVDGGTTGTCMLVDPTTCM
jgi:hypothetical protein